ncbi:MAG: class I SAM-dependent methyltransferase [Sulfuricella sp.]|nr:class I SAM-dependent methyltransferase [Sulfuricella sp.]
MEPKEHWNAVYSARSPEQLGWYQAHPEISLRLIAESGVAKDAAIIDVGGGASLLVDKLVAGGYTEVTVLDVSAAALAAAQARLGSRAQTVTWLEADATRFAPSRHYALWHDRAVFHFLTEPADRQAYLRAVEQALLPGAQLIIATFAPDGPEKCSGLPVVRYGPQELANEVGENFELLESCGETHTTPGGVKQSFSYCRFRRR